MRSKLFKNINVIPKTIKLLEKNIGNIYFDINHSDNFFLDLFPQGKETKAKVTKHYYIKVKSFCTVKETDRLQ